MRNIFHILIILLPVLTARGQGEQPILPLEYSQLYQTMPLLNPAAYFDKYKYSVLAGRQGNGEILKNVFTNYLYASATLGGRFRTHVIGVSMFQDQDSRSLRRSRLFLNYSIHFRLTKKIEAGAGFAGGLFNYKVDINDPKVTVNRSMVTIDGNIGVFVRSEKIFGGFSIIQFPQGTLIPYKARARLIPSWQILFGKNFTLSPYIVVNSLIAARLTDKKTDGNLAVNAIFSEVFLVGANLNPRKSFSILAGLEGVSVSGMYLSPVFSFSIPFGAFKLATNPYEITLKLQLKKYEQKGLLFSRLTEK